MFIWIYYLVSAGLFITLIRQCWPDQLAKRAANPHRMDALFLVLALLLLAVMRVPSVCFNQELNPDESQLLTQALTLVQDPVYGRSVDGTSIGPVNSYLLLLPGLLGLPTDYIAARVIGLLLIMAALVLFFSSLLRFVSPLTSRLILLVIVAFFAWSTHSDFLHYSSELSSLVIITASGLLTIKLLQSTSQSTMSLVGLGLVAGLTPYCKLQTLPVVGMMLITLTLCLFSQKRMAAIRPLVWVGLGFVGPTLLVFGFGYVFGVDRYFIDYYFVGNLSTYAQIYASVPLVQQGFMAKLLRFPAFLLQYTDFLLFIAINCFAVAALALMAGRRMWHGEINLTWTTILVLLTAVGALWATITPGTEFGHHLLLLVFPLGWVMAISFQFLIQNRPVWVTPIRLVGLVCAMLVADIALSDNLLLSYSGHLLRAVRHKPETAADQELRTNPTAWLLARNRPLFSFPNHTQLRLSPVSKTIRQYAVQSDKMAVWGWNCQYYVETQLAQGVSENHTQRSSIPNVMQGQYLTRYATELRDNRPVLFLDAVGHASLILDKPCYRHEHFAQVNHIIEQNYQLVTTVDSVRIYVRRDRLVKGNQLVIN